MDFAAKMAAATRNLQAGTTVLAERRPTKHAALEDPHLIFQGSALSTIE